MNATESAFYDWWNETGDSLSAGAGGHGVEYNAFLAGAEWMREQCEAIVREVGGWDSGEDGWWSSADEAASKIHELGRRQ